MPCNDCPPGNDCSTLGVSQVYWDAAITSCLSQLGVVPNQSLSVVLSSIASALCDLINDPTPITCSSMGVDQTYENIGFVGTDETTACDLFSAIDTRFGTILHFNFTNCFGVGEDYNDAVSAMMSKLCADLYTTNTWKFLPLDGNSITALQQFIDLQPGSGLFWINGGVTTPPSIIGDSSGLTISGGDDGLGVLNKVLFQTPVYHSQAEHAAITDLSAPSTTLLADNVTSLNFINKSLVLSVYLPDTSTLTILNQIITFSALTLGQSVVNCKIYPASGSGDTVNSTTEYNFGLDVDTVTFVSSGTNWRVLSYTKF